MSKKGKGSKKNDEKKKKKKKKKDNTHVAQSHVRFWHLADIDANAEHVRF